MNNTTRVAYIFSSILLAIAILGATLYLLLDNDTPTATVQILPPLPTNTPAPTHTPSPVVVYVTGAVQSPQDLLELPHGSRVADAITAAGGPANDANLEAVNLAQILHDGDMIYVPFLSTEPDTTTSFPVSSPTPNTTSATAPVNINSATLEELDALPGIGPVKAQAIIDYRTANGPFASIEDVTNVTGIGPATLENLRPFITVGP